MRRVTKDIRHGDGDGGFVGHGNGLMVSTFQQIGNHPKEG